VTVLATAVTLAVVLGVILSARAPASPKLPQVSSRALAAHVVDALERDPSVSGHVQVHVDLGIPQLPSADGETPVAGPLSLLSAISGDHTLRVWRSRDGIRIAEILPAEERGVFVNSRAAWLWDSNGLRAYHVAAPPTSPGGNGEERAPRPGQAQLDPAALAARFLHAINPSTAVSVGDPTTVAGQPVYPLLLDPRTTGTLVGRVEIDVDAQNWIPLRVAVFPRGAVTAAASVGYTSVSFDRIDPSTFGFTPPPGSTVKTITLAGAPRSNPAGTPMIGARNRVSTFGTTWTEIVAVRLPSSPSSAASRSSSALGQIERLLPYSGPLLSIDLVDRGAHRYLVAGMVPPSALGVVESRLP
jgi:hypothetical protein